MTTSKEREAAFRCDLVKLLEKHGAGMCVTECDYDGPYCMVMMPSKWNDAGVLTDDYTEFRL